MGWRMLRWKENGSVAEGGGEVYEAGPFGNREAEGWQQQEGEDELETRLKG